MSSREVKRVRNSYVSAFNERQVMLREDFEIFHYEGDEPCSVPPHSHDYYEIYCLLSGVMDYVVVGRRYALRPGNLLLIAPGQVHWPDVGDAARSFERIVLWVSAEMAEALLEALPEARAALSKGVEGQNLIVPDKDAYDTILGQLTLLLREKRAPDSDSDAMCRLALTQLMLHLSRYLRRAPRTPHPKPELRYAEIMRVYDYIREHLQDNLSVAGLAELFFMDKNTLTRQFKRLIGMTPGEYIRRSRLEAARALIDQGMRIQEACAECGFSDYSTFYRAFRCVYGLSPSDYADQLRAGAPMNSGGEYE